jgi:hypothetical protein
MNPRELVDHIRSGLVKLELDEPLRFRRRTRSNPCDFNDFLQALQSSETLRTVECGPHVRLGIKEDEWIRLVKTIGRIKGIEDLRFSCKPGSRLFQAVAEAVNSAQSLRKVKVIIRGETFPTDPPAGLAALASALREHTALQEFHWFDFRYRREVAPRNLSLDPVLRALPACPHLRSVTIMTEYASADAIKNMLQLQSATDLKLLLTMDQGLAVADEIRRGHCNVQRLNLILFPATTSEATKGVNAVASAIRLDRNLEHFTLGVEDAFTDEAGVALAEALTVNKTLCKIISSAQASTLGPQAYEAFSAMLRVNTNLVLELPPFVYVGGDERFLECRNQMIIEQRLNEVGRGRLLSSKQTTREEYVDALHELSIYDINDSPDFQVICLYSLLRLNPSVVCMS